MKDDNIFTQESTDDEFDTFLRSYRKNKNKPVRVLLALYKGNMRKILASCFFFIIKASPVWVIPIVTANIVDIATKQKGASLHALWLNIAIAVIFILLNLPTHMLFVRNYSIAIRNVEAGLRSTLIRRLQQLSISFHKEFKSGRMQSKVIRDVENIEFLSQQIMNSILSVLVSTIVVLSIVISKSLLMTSFFLVAIPTALLLVSLFRKNMRAKNNAFRTEIEETSARVAEMVEMIPVTKAHGLEDIEIEKMDTQLTSVRTKGYLLDMVTALFGASAWVTMQLFQIACLGFTGFLAYSGKISTGDVVLYQAYFSQLLNQIANILNIYPNIAKGIESIHSVGEILLSEDIEDNTGKIRLPDLIGEYGFSDVTFCYPDGQIPVLQDFSLHVQPGECIALVGESGAGKTTILNMLIGFGFPNSGTLTVDGYDISAIDLKAYRQQIAVVPQNTILFSGSIRDNIAYGLLSVTPEQLTEAVVSANLQSMIDALPNGLDTQIGEHGGKISGGQRQRIAIARALIRNPRMIILDEATSALDAHSEREVQLAMHNLIKGRTTFISAHRLSTIRDADRILLIHDGRVVESGTFDELIAQKGEFYQMNVLQTNTVSLTV